MTRGAGGATWPKNGPDGRVFIVDPKGGSSGALVAFVPKRRVQSGMYGERIAQSMDGSSSESSSGTGRSSPSRRSAIR